MIPYRLPHSCRDWLNWVYCIPFNHTALWNIMPPLINWNRLWQWHHCVQYSNCVDDACPAAKRQVRGYSIFHIKIASIFIIKNLWFVFHKAYPLWNYILIIHSDSTEELYLTLVSVFEYWCSKFKNIF